MTGPSRAGTWLVLRLVHDLAAAATACPLVLSPWLACRFIVALAAAEEGCWPVSGPGTIKAGVFMTSSSYSAYLGARVADPSLQDRRAAL